MILIISSGRNVNIYYIKNTIIASYNINSVKCSPINMFLKSINNEETGQGNFADCVYLLNQNNTTST